MDNLLVPIIAVLVVSTVVWWFSASPAGRGKHAIGKHTHHRVAVREPAAHSGSDPDVALSPPSQFDFETAPLVDEPPRSSSFLRISLVILAVALIAVVLVWIFGVLLNLQLSRYFGR